jgi:hypothetical protein
VPKALTEKQRRTQQYGQKQSRGECHKGNDMLFRYPAQITYCYGLNLGNDADVLPPAVIQEVPQVLHITPGGHLAGSHKVNSVLDGEVLDVSKVLQIRSESNVCVSGDWSVTTAVPS